MVKSSHATSTSTSRAWIVKLPLIPFLISNSHLHCFLLCPAGPAHPGPPLYRQFPLTEQPQTGYSTFRARVALVLGVCLSRTDFSLALTQAVWVHGSTCDSTRLPTGLRYIQVRLGVFGGRVLDWSHPGFTCVCQCYFSSPSIKKLDAELDVDLIDTIVF
jgi:hypothetical protein